MTEPELESDDLQEEEGCDGPTCEECGDSTIDCENLNYCDRCLGHAVAEAEARVDALDIRVAHIPENWDIDFLYNVASLRNGRPVEFGDEAAILNWLRHEHTNYHDLLRELDESTKRFLKRKVNSCIIAELEAAGIFLQAGGD